MAGCELEELVALGRDIPEAVYALIDLSKEELQDGEPREKTDRDYYFYSLAQLLLHDFKLQSWEAFLGRIKPAMPALKKEDFQADLLSFLTHVDPKIPLPTSDLTDFLFKRASSARGHIAVYSAMCHMLRGNEYKKMLCYLNREVVRFSKIRQLVAAGDAAPGWAWDFMRLRSAALNELVNDTLGRLVSARDHLKMQSSILKFGRTDLESHVILNCKEPIRRQIKGTPFERKARSATCCIRTCVEDCPR